MYPFITTSASCPYGLFTLHGNWTRTGTGNRTDTIGNNGPWFLSIDPIPGPCAIPTPLPVPVLMQCGYTIRMGMGVNYK